MLYLYNNRISRFYKPLILFLGTLLFLASAALGQEPNFKEKIKDLKDKELSEERIEEMLPAAKKRSGGASNIARQEPEDHMTPRNTGTNELSSANIYEVYEDSQGRIYALTGEAVDIVTDNGTWRHLDAGAGEELPGNPNQVIEDEENRIWIATSNGLVEFDADLNKQATIDTNRFELKMDAIHTMAMMENGNLWLGHREINISRNPDSISYAGGISVYNPTQEEVTTVRDTGLVAGPISDIHVRDNGDIWTSVAPGDRHTEEGIYVYRPSDDSAWTYRQSNSDIPQNQVSNLAEDSQGTMWLGLSDTDQEYQSYSSVDDTLDGVASFDGTDWTDHSETQTELSSNCRALAVDNQDNIYYGSRDTTMIFDGSGWSAFTGGKERFPLDGLRSMMINSNGNKVFATSTGDDRTGGGIHTETSGGWEFLSTQNDGGLFSNRIYGLTADNQGRIWASGSHGVAYRENGEWTYFNTHDGLASPFTWKIMAASNGTIWMSNGSNGITRFENGEFEVYDEYGAFEESIMEDSNGDIWMGSYRNDEQPGILQYDGNQYTHHDTVDNILGQYVYALAEGPEGNIIASSEAGLAKYDGQEWARWTPEENNFEGEMESDADKNIWIGTPDSLVKWDGSSLNSYTPPQGSFSYALHLEAGPDGSLWINTFYSEMDSVSGEHKYITNILDNESWSQVTTGEYPYVTAHDSSGSTWIGTYQGGLYKFNRESAVAVEEETARPEQYSLGDNYPNPFNPSTKISFNLPTQSHVKLKVFDMLGREVATLVDEQRHAGRHQVGFDASNLASGIYMYRIEAGSFTETRKMVLVK